jgi:L-alanine-DL-glutamate epimerase-like enolase superfamily enzyme
MSLSKKAEILTAFHDCTGPVSLAVATQVSLASENTKVQEVARAFWHSWYGQMASGYPELVGGDIHVSDAAGHGAALLPEFIKAQTTTVRQSTLR